MENPNNHALDYVEWLRMRTNIVELTEDIAMEAGELKKRLRIALPCVVLATARALGASPVFRSLEKEMKPVLGQLRELGVLFLDELSSS